MLIDRRRYDKEIFELEMAFIRCVSRREALRTVRGLQATLEECALNEEDVDRREHMLSMLLRCRSAAAT